MQEIIKFVNNHPILCLMWAILLAMVVVTIFKGILYKVNIISCSEATYLINKKDAVVVDIRSRDEFHKGHILGAYNILAVDIKNGNFNKLAKYKNKHIILVCATGNSAFNSAVQLSAAGFVKVSVLKEGIIGWSYENLPLIRGK